MGNPILLKAHFHQNWDREFGMAISTFDSAAAVKQTAGLGLVSMSQELNGGSPETAPSVLKLRIMGAA